MTVMDRTTADPAYAAHLERIEATRKPVDRMNGCGGCSLSSVTVVEPNIVMFQGDVIGGRPKSFEEGREGTWYPGHGFVAGNSGNVR